MHRSVSPTNGKLLYSKLLREKKRPAASRTSACRKLHSLMQNTGNSCFVSTWPRVLSRGEKKNRNSVSVMNKCVPYIRGNRKLATTRSRRRRVRESPGYSRIRLSRLLFISRCVARSRFKPPAGLVSRPMVDSVRGRPLRINPRE